MAGGARTSNLTNSENGIISGGGTCGELTSCNPKYFLRRPILTATDQWSRDEDPNRPPSAHFSRALLTPWPPSPATKTPTLQEGNSCRKYWGHVRGKGRGKWRTRLVETAGRPPCYLDLAINTRLEAGVAASASNFTCPAHVTLRSQRASRKHSNAWALGCCFAKGVGNFARVLFRMENFILESAAKSTTQNQEVLAKFPQQGGGGRVVTVVQIVGHLASILFAFAHQTCPSDVSCPSGETHC